jgi:hypothetical protein
MAVGEFVPNRRGKRHCRRPNDRLRYSIESRAGFAIFGKGDSSSATGVIT